MARSRKPLRIPVVAEVKEALDRFKKVERGIENVGDTARETSRDFDRTFDGAERGAESAEHAAKRVEGAFRRLSVKTEQTADKQRQRLIEAYEEIQRSGTATPEEIGRAYKMLEVRLARINKQIGRDATDPYIKARRTAREAVEDIRRNFQRLGASLRDRGRGISDVGGAFTARVSAPIAVGFGLAIKTAGDFEAAMKRIEGSIKPTRNELEALKDTAIRLGSETSFSASEAAAAIETLGKNGLTAEQILNGAADAALALASATGVSLSEAADIATDAMATFGKQASDLPGLMNQIVGVTNNSKLGIQDYAYFLGQAGGAAATAGLSLEDLNAGVVATASYFKEGSNAGAAFKNFLLQLSGATKGKKKLIAEAGFNFYDAQGNLRGLPDIAETLRQGIDGKSEKKIANVLGSLFGTRSVATAKALAEQGAEGVNEALAKIGKGNAAEQAGKRLEGFNGQMKQLQSKLETLAIQIGESGILEAMTRLVEKVSEFVAYLNEQNPALLKWGTITALVVAALGPLLLGLGAAVTGIGMLGSAISGVLGVFSALSGAFMFVWRAIAPLVSAVGSFLARIVALRGGLLAIGRVLLTVAGVFVSWPVLLGAAIGAAVGLIYHFWDEIKAFATNAAGAVARIVGNVPGYVSDAVSSAASTISDVLDHILESVVGIGGDIAEAIGDGFRAAWNAALDIDWGAIGDKIISGLGDAARFVTTPYRVGSEYGARQGRRLGEAMGFATGGYVSGPGTSTSDSIAARLSDGEYVINSRAVSAFGRTFFDDVNAMRMPAPEFAGVPVYDGTGDGGSGGGRPIYLNLWGEDLAASVDEETAHKIERHQRRRGAARPSRLPRYA